MKKLGLAMALAFSFAGAQANAFIVEPFVGYESGDYESGATKEDISGTNIGIRLGGTSVGFMYGVEYQTGSLTIDATPEVDADTTDIGLFVGFNFPILIRAYATYYLSHEADVGTANNLEGDGGMKLGVSYTGLPFVALNFEMMSREFDEQGPSTIDVTTDTFMVGVGLPLP